ncbi:MAG: hypothetical protein SangKO_011770 [Sandaracinaceae bacterium]
MGRAVAKLGAIATRAKAEGFPMLAGEIARLGRRRPEGVDSRLTPERDRHRLAPRECAGSPPLSFGWAGAWRAVRVRFTLDAGPAGILEYYQALRDDPGFWDDDAVRQVPQRARVDRRPDRARLHGRFRLTYSNAATAAA